MTFQSKNQNLQKSFDKKKLTVINKKVLPVSPICDSCWYKGKCITRILKREPPLTCFVYDFFSNLNKKEASLEEVVNFTCETKCKARQLWQGDPVPHDESYCENHCPVSGYILDRKASDEEDIPKLGEL